MFAPCREQRKPKLKGQPSKTFQRSTPLFTTYKHFPINHFSDFFLFFPILDNPLQLLTLQVVDFGDDWGKTSTTQSPSCNSKDMAIPFTMEQRRLEQTRVSVRKCRSRLCGLQQGS
jgi:hypothetical protein